MKNRTRLQVLVLIGASKSSQTLQNSIRTQKMLLHRWAMSGQQTGTGAEPDWNRTRTSSRPSGSVEGQADTLQGCGAAGSAVLVTSSKHRTVCVCVCRCGCVCVEGDVDIFVLLFTFIDSLIHRATLS